METKIKVSLESHIRQRREALLVAFELLYDIDADVALVFTKSDVPLIQGRGGHQVVCMSGYDLWNHKKRCKPHIKKPNATRQEAIDWLSM